MCWLRGVKIFGRSDEWQAIPLYDLRVRRKADYPNWNIWWLSSVCLHTFWDRTVARLQTHVHTLNHTHVCARAHTHTHTHTYIYIYIVICTSVARQSLHQSRLLQRRTAMIVVGGQIGKLGKEYICRWKPLPQDWSRQLTEATRTLANCRVCETAIALQLIIDTSCMI
jgi:hypothetical protein